MGINFRASFAAWTLLLVPVIADDTLLIDLGLGRPMDVSKINISQDEYTRVMNLYLERRRLHTDQVPKLFTFDSDKSDMRLRFPIRASSRHLEVENAQLRILAPALANPSHPRIQVTQILSARRRRVVDDKQIYLSSNASKWCDFDVTSAVQSWLNGAKNLGLELVCIDCSSNYLKTLKAAISALVYAEPRRSKRFTSPYQPARRTDCVQSRNGKQKCCRHDMNVKFSELKIFKDTKILQPAAYEAGFCQGQCPFNSNHATNHSRIQSFIHQKMHRKGKSVNRRDVPKPCCTPSKLEPLEVLRVNPSDTTKLLVEKWENMKVIECACS